MGSSGSEGLLGEVGGYDCPRGLLVTFDTRGSAERFLGAGLHREYVKRRPNNRPGAWEPAVELKPPCSRWQLGTIVFPCGDGGHPTGARVGLLAGWTASTRLWSLQEDLVPVQLYALCPARLTRLFSLAVFRSASHIPPLTADSLANEIFKTP